MIKENKFNLKTCKIFVENFTPFSKLVDIKLIEFQKGHLKLELPHHLNTNYHN